MLLLVVVDVGRSPTARLLTVRLMGRILRVRRWRRSADVIWHAVTGTGIAAGTVRARRRLTRLAAGTARLAVRARILRPGRVTALRMW